MALFARRKRGGGGGRGSAVVLLFLVRPREAPPGSGRAAATAAGGADTTRAGPQGFCLAALGVVFLSYPPEPDAADPWPKGGGGAKAASEAASEARRRESERKAKRLRRQRGLGTVARNGTQDRCFSAVAAPLDNLKGKRSTWIYSTRSKLGGEYMRYSHMAMLEKFSNGSVVAAWQAGRETEAELGQSIWYRFSKDKEGRRWWPARRLKVRQRSSLWSPVLHLDKSGALMLFYAESRDCIRPKAGRYPDRSVPGGDIKVTSTRNGVAWSDPVLVLSQNDDGGAPKVLANKPIVTRNGNLVLPFWREVNRSAKGTRPGLCPVKAMKGSAGVLISQDHGRSWSPNGDVVHNSTWLIENSVIEQSKQHLVMYFRTFVGRVFESHSFDGGLAWDEPEHTSLQNPDSKLHAVRLKNGGLLMAHNDHPKFHDDGFIRFRTNLILSYSNDAGATSRTIAKIDEDDEPGWQYHYPCILEVSDCSVLVAYSKIYMDVEGYTKERLEDGIRVMEVKLPHRALA